MKKQYIGCLILIGLFFPMVVTADGNDYSTTGQAGFYGVYESETNTSSDHIETSDSSLPSTKFPITGSQQTNQEGYGILPSTGSKSEYIVSFIGLLLSLGLSILIQRKREEIK
ncbi:LPXTG cell wall anchor domain-containing protein [uncultured Enterococcus sp.]|uniref:LPXTG cell wall anchor domain-containing protein n=1 Tax=uncultured Enterococcus sp. TaxID=167972 RepID=UPI0025E53D6B|nr:LPXTG cell wall anchor domain-containing protein [uncultured Enterococcus sp.]